jgi:hypothetical protein
MSWINRNKWYLGGGLALAIIGLAYILSRKSGLLGGVKANDWSSENDFWKVGASDLQAIAKSNGVTLTHNKGLGGNLSDSAVTTALNRPKVSWAVYDITRDKLLAQSINASKNMYGASVSKAVVVACAYNNNGGKLPSQGDVGKAIRLLTVSDNNTWDALVKLAGGNDSVDNFSKNLGLANMLPSRSNNKINPVGMCMFWNETLRNKYKGAESVFKISSSCQTHSSRSRKYLPKTSYVGGKTGTWNNQYTHDSAFFNVGSKWYAITVLSDGSDSSETIALVFGGLFKKYCK